MTSRLRKTANTESSYFPFSPFYTSSPLPVLSWVWLLDVEGPDVSVFVS